MRICEVQLYYDPRIAGVSPYDYLATVPILRYLPRALAERGHQVEVVHLFPQSAELNEEGIRYHFVASGSVEQRLAGMVGRATGRERTRGQLAAQAIRLIRALRPDVVHFHGLILTLNLLALQEFLGRSGPPVIGHYHGGYPAETWLLQRLQRLSLRRLEMALFTTVTHAEPFVSSGMLDPGQVVELMEVSSHFRRLDQEAARQVTGMEGSPVFLWTGRLDPVKDPLTALRGFKRIRAGWPQANLYLYYLTDEMLPEMRLYVAAQPELDGHVHFRGRAPYDQMEMIYSSADFFLQASRREYSGYAILEAMACGAIPVVSDIPSFRAMTDGGRYGILFEGGDAEGMARQFWALDPAEIPARSAEVRKHFERALSYEAMAGQLEEIYLQAVANNQQVNRS